MSVYTALNVKRYVCCDMCARRGECEATHPLLPLLVLLKANGKCEAMVLKTEGEK